jgi:hypothetical protein
MADPPPEAPAAGAPAAGAPAAADADPELERFLEHVGRVMDNFPPELRVGGSGSLEDFATALCGALITGVDAAEAERAAERSLAALCGAGGAAAVAAPAARPARSCAVCGAAARPDGGRLLVCSRCQNTRFCSADCQRRAWPLHKESCRRGG